MNTYHLNDNFSNLKQEWQMHDKGISAKNVPLYTQITTITIAIDNSSLGPTSLYIVLNKVLLVIKSEE